MTKILVTGATGRLGGQVVEFLLRPVAGVTNNQTSAFHPGRKFGSQFSMTRVDPKQKSDLRLLCARSGTKGYRRLLRANAFFGLARVNQD
jgi:nucleoside-diphosphate-sugar epimerase